LKEGLETEMRNEKHLRFVYLFFLIDYFGLPVKISSALSKDFTLKFQVKALLLRKTVQILFRFCNFIIRLL